MTANQIKEAIISLNNLRDYLVEQNLRIKAIDQYLYDVQYMDKEFNADEAIDVCLKVFNHMSKEDKHEHAPAFNVVVKFLCRMR